MNIYTEETADKNSETKNEIKILTKSIKFAMKVQHLIILDTSESTDS